VCANSVPHPQDAFAVILSAFQDACQVAQRVEEEEMEEKGSGTGDGGNTDGGEEGSSEGGAAASIRPSGASTNGSPRLSTASLLQLLSLVGNRVEQACARRQVPLDHSVIQQQHTADGMASQLQLAAMAIQHVMAAAAAAVTASPPLLSPSPSSPFCSPVPLLQSFNGFLESLLGVILQDVDGPHTTFYLRQALAISAYISLPHRRTAARIEGSWWATEHRQFFALSLLISTLLCVKLFRLPSLLNFAFAKASELGRGIGSVEGIIARVHPCLGSYGPHSADVGPCVPSGAGVLLFDPTPSPKSLFAASNSSPRPAGSNGSAEKVEGWGGGRLTSYISGGCIVGPAVPLTVYNASPSSSSSPAATTTTTVYISKEEAMQWQMISHFSPTLDGSRFYATM